MGKFKQKIGWYNMAWNWDTPAILAPD